MEMGEGRTFPRLPKGNGGKHVYTVSDILADIDRGCMANNMVEDMFSYRIIFYVNEGNKGTKHYTDAGYRDLRKALENIVRNNLSLTNNLVIAETTALKNGKCVCLLSKSYSFSLDQYFRQISGEGRSGRTENPMYGKYAVG